MGGDGRYPYPKEVWSPAGGWWPFPRAWRANTAAAFVITAALCVPVFILSESKTVRHQPSTFIPLHLFLPFAIMPLSFAACVLKQSFDRATFLICSVRDRLVAAA